MEILLLVVAFASVVRSVEITCSFNRVQCTVYGIANPEITELVAVDGNLPEGITYEDIIFFRVEVEGFLAFPKGLEKYFPNLIEIWMSNSKITYLEPDTFAPWPGLTKLFFGHNKIEFLDRDLFQNNPKLWYLAFYGNSIRNLDGDLFKHNPWVEAVFFQNNRIRNAGADLLSNLEALKVVDFANNLCINEYADTPQGVLNIKDKLLAQCPQLDTTETPRTPTTTSATTTMGSCSARCSINEEVDEIKTVTDYQGSIIHGQSLRMDEQHMSIEVLKTLLEEQAGKVERLERRLSMCQCQP